MSSGSAVPSAAGAAAGSQSEAQRLLSIGEKLLHNRDLTGAREFAVLSQETEPLLEGSDQILAICDVLLAGDKRVGITGAGNNDHDWYAILQVERRSGDSDIIRRNYRRLALLLHPDKNKFPHADSAFRLVADAWTVLSDRSKKSNYDAQLSRLSKVELTSRSARNPPQSEKTPVRRSSRKAGGGVGDAGATPKSMYGSDSGSAGRKGGSRISNFWTACPYCYVLYEYPRTYEDCCLRCQSCERAFHAAAVPSLPPMVPGKEAYYCCWGFFPLGFSLLVPDAKNGTAPSSGAFPNWMPPMFSGGKATDAVDGAPVAGAAEYRRETVVDVSDGNASGRGGPEKVGTDTVAGSGATPAKKKRGRPRKNPL